MSSPIPPDVLARMAELQLEFPRGPLPGRPWRPVTHAEDMLLRQAQRLDGIRRQLLAEHRRLTGQARSLAGRVTELEQETTRLHRALLDKPLAEPMPHLSPEEREVLAAAAAGEGLDATARRLQISPSVLKYRRKRILQRYRADTFTQAVALAVDAGDVRPSRTGVAP
ncbi:LuxR C-terminal-related transcriptional regulator [Streptomyces sp. NPDC048389]|uniref:LuxR C-terminal-related transcriptional regulator n=1 Tax=Streptomyces sp. NPDC048389 TaxID=3154622 RepID=UPI003451874D